MVPRRRTAWLGVVAAWLACLASWPAAASARSVGAYVANWNAGTVPQFDVGAGGTLTPKAPATVAAGVNPHAVALSPDARNAYVAGSNAVRQFDVGADGALTPKVPAAVPSGGLITEAVAVSPDGRSVYVVN